MEDPEVIEALEKGDKLTEEDIEAMSNGKLFRRYRPLIHGIVESKGEKLISIKPQKEGRITVINDALTLRK